MKLIFEVLKFAFELLYASYQYEVDQMKDDYHVETPSADIEFIEESRE